MLAAVFATAVLVGLAVALEAGLSVVTSYVPELVLLVVVAAGLATSTTYGAATGFGSGLLLDLAPASASFVGTGALAFTVVGWLAGVVGTAWRPDGPAIRLLRSVAVAAGGTLVVGLVFACCAVLFDERRFDWPSVTELLRSSVPVTVAVAPLLVPGMVALLRRCGS